MVWLGRRLPSVREGQDRVVVDAAMLSALLSGIELEIPGPREQRPSIHRHRFAVPIRFGSQGDNGSCLILQAQLLWNSLE